MRLNLTTRQLIDFVSTSNQWSNANIDVRNTPNPISCSRFFHLVNDRYTVSVSKTRRDLALVDDENTLSLGFQSASGKIAPVLTARSSKELADRLLVDPKNTPEEISSLLSNHLVVGTSNGRLIGFSKLPKASLPDFLTGVQLYEHQFDAPWESASTLFENSKLSAFAESIRFLVSLDLDQDVSDLSQTAHAESDPLWDEIITSLPSFKHRYDEGGQQKKMEMIVSKLIANGLLTTKYLCTANEIRLRKIFSSEEIELIRRILTETRFNLSFL